MKLKTFTPPVVASANRKWYLVDAAGKTLGHLATRAADLLRGKNKPTFTPHMDQRDYVVIINAEKVRVSGAKESQKEYIHHTGYMGHLRRKPLAAVRKENLARILKEAVSGMLPINRLRRQLLTKLFIYAGAEHPHKGQNPQILNF